MGVAAKNTTGVTVMNVTAGVSVSTAQIKTGTGPLHLAVALTGTGVYDMAGQGRMTATVTVDAAGVHRGGGTADLGVAVTGWGANDQYLPALLLLATTGNAVHLASSGEDGLHAFTVDEHLLVAST